MATRSADFPPAQPSAHTTETSTVRNGGSRVAQRSPACLQPLTGLHACSRRQLGPSRSSERLCPAYPRSGRALSTLRQGLLPAAIIPASEAPVRPEGHRHLVRHGTGPSGRLLALGRLRKAPSGSRRAQHLASSVRRQSAILVRDGACPASSRAAAAPLPVAALQPDGAAAEHAAKLRPPYQHQHGRLYELVSPQRCVVLKPGASMVNACRRMRSKCPGRAKTPAWQRMTKVSEPHRCADIASMSQCVSKVHDDMAPNTIAPVRYAR